MTQLVGWMSGAANPMPSAARAAVDRAAGATGARQSTLLTNSMAAALGAKDSAGRTGLFGSVSIAYVGRPRLTTSADGSGRIADAASIAARFRQVGNVVLEELRGPFALALFDADRSLGLIATDRMGVFPLFFCSSNGGLGFGSVPGEAAAVSGLKARIRPQAIFDYLYSHVIPAPLSLFEGVQRLLPGECVELAGDRATPRRYWRPRFEEGNPAKFDDLRTEFMHVLRSSVHDAMQGAVCGAFLSGGTDSSTIAGMMTQVGGEPARTYSIGFAAEGFDEMEYARLASRHFGTRHHEYYVTPRDVAAAAPMIAATHPQPFGNSSAVPAFFCARLAREDGVERMLGGDGGDELFGGNARYAKQRVMSYYEDLVPAALRRTLVEPVVHALSRRGRLPVVGKIVSYVEQAAVPMPERLETYNLLLRLGCAGVLTDDVLAATDLDEPARLNRDAYMNDSASSLINRMLALDFKTTLGDNDLPKVMQSCRLADVAVDFPMLDARVVDFSLGLRPEHKLAGTRLRPFFKDALRDFLPPEIIRKQKHGFGLPFGEWALRDSGLRALTFDSLNSLKQRGFVRPPFIDRLKDELLPQYPNYYGTFAWVLMMLELWLQQHQTSAQPVTTPLQAHVESA